MKNLKTGLTLILLIFMAAPTLLSAQNQQPTGITVNGEGVVKVTPDRAKIKVRVEHQGQTANEVKTQTDQSINQVLDFLKNEKISANDYQIDYINLNKQYDYNTKETTYKAEQSVTITLKDIDRYSTIMTGLMKSGINRIDGVTFEDSQLEKHQKEARLKAVANAREKAEDYANALNLKLGAAQMLTEANGGSAPRTLALQAMSFDASNAGGDSSPIAVGQIEIKQQVEVRFGINLK